MGTSDCHRLEAAFEGCNIDKKGNSPCPGTSIFPSHSTSGNGLPLANKHRPSVFLTASSNVHSLLLDGFESGNTMGRSFNDAILRRMSGVNAPPMVDRPM